jgi:FkbM family methyltransferase
VTIFDAIRAVRFRRKLRLPGHLVPSRGIREAAICGFKMKLDLSQHIDRTVYLGCYARELGGVLQRFLSPGMTVVDAGASIGYLPRFSRSSVGPNGTVISIEPNRKAFAQLNALKERNQLNNVSCFGFVLSDRPGPVWLSTLQLGTTKKILLRRQRRSTDATSKRCRQTPWIISPTGASGPNRSAKTLCDGLRTQGTDW